MSDLQLGEIVPVEAPVTGDQFIRLVKRVGGDEEVGEDAVARFHGFTDDFR
mgnify:CR=1 FL=1